MYIRQNKIIVNDKKYTFRLLTSKDEKILSEFFKNITPDIKTKYNPHLFDNKTAVDICSSKDRKFKRVICIHEKSIIAYCIIYFKLRIWEKTRFDEEKIFMKDDDVCTIAPCVLDDYQRQGIGTGMFKYVLRVANFYNKKYILLWGGVIIKNKGAVNYYKKMEFKIIKEWWHSKSKVMCYDMRYEI